MFKVAITEVLVGEIEVEAENMNDAIKQVRAAHEEAGRIVKKLETEEMTARIIHGQQDKTITLI